MAGDYSKAPEIMRAFQRDEEYKHVLRFMAVEALEVFINYRTLNKYDSEIRMGSDFIYYALTTLIGKQTLGEEYCSIRPVYEGNGEFPSKVRRVILLLFKLIGPYIIGKAFKAFE